MSIEPAAMRRVQATIRACSDFASSLYALSAAADLGGRGTNALVRR